MIFPCQRCGCMPPGSYDPTTTHRSMICRCPADELNQWWLRNSDRLEQDRTRARLIAWETAA
jgi:hypothetical protein